MSARPFPPALSCTLHSGEGIPIPGPSGSAPKDKNQHQPEKLLRRKENASEIDPKKTRREPGKPDHPDARSVSHPFPRRLPRNTTPWVRPEKQADTKRTQQLAKNKSN